MNQLSRHVQNVGFLIISGLLLPNTAFAVSNASDGKVMFETILLFTLLLFFAKLGGVVEKLGIPGVLGELLAGVVLSVYGFLGLPLIEQLRSSEVILFFAQFGAILLLFQVGLESNIRQMVSVGSRSLVIAVVGIVAPFVLGTFVIGPLFFGYASFVTHVFIGASIVATSVGITATVFKELGISKTKTAQTVIGAAVIDDILGLLLLAVVSAFVSDGGLSAGSIIILTVKAFSFLAIAVIIGQLFAEPISKLFSNLHTGTGMKLSLVILIALSYSYAATLFGLEPIIGAFAAGLVLDAVHFRFFDLPKVAYDLARLKGCDDNEQCKINDLKQDLEHTHVEDMVQSVSIIFVPIFFAYTGLQINVESLLNPALYATAILCTVIAVFGKLIAGFVARGNLQDKLIIGFSMVPRGEVGLIFLSIGKSLGVLSESIFSVLLIVTVLTTFIAPMALKYLCIRRSVLITDATYPVRPAYRPLRQK